MEKASPYDPWAMFAAETPAGLLPALCHQLLLAYNESHDHCGANFEREEAHDLYPKERRAMVERNIRHIAQRFEGVKADAVRNSTGGAFHARLRFGNVVLTVSAVSGPKQMVRLAKFREQYARDPQRTMSFDLEPEADQVSEEEALYAILLHGPDKKRKSFPAFMRVAFPDKKCKKYIDNVDLLSRYPEVEALLRPEIETIAAPRPRLIRRPAEKRRE